MRSVLINAERDTVFRFFTDSALFAAWWGAGSSIDARPGGRVHICYPNAVIASGSVESVSPPERIVFTYGYEDAQRGMPPGSSRVTVELTASAEGTLLVLTHEFESEQQRTHHDAGWRFQLSVFANVAARTQHADAAQTLDRWFAAWSETRSAQRLEQLRAITDPAIRVRDRFAAIEGLEELNAHVGATHVHMPGTVITRDGALRECQGAYLVDWNARGSAGQPTGKGTSFVAFSPAGRILTVIGFWPS